VGHFPEEKCKSVDDGGAYQKTWAKSSYVIILAFGASLTWV